LVLLRKCLVLSDRLKAWTDKELDGYRIDEEIPPYRITRAHAKGHLFGPLNAIIRDQPPSPHVLKEKHRHFALTAKLDGSDMNRANMPTKVR
jgi:hypothetical protein